MDLIDSPPFSRVKSRSGASALYAVLGLVVDSDDSDVLASLEAVLDSLPLHERVGLYLRFGLEDGRPRSLREVDAAIYPGGPVSPERARRIEARAVRKLRHPSRHRHLTSLGRPTDNATEETWTST